MITQLEKKRWFKAFPSFLGLLILKSCNPVYFV